MDGWKGCNLKRVTDRLPPSHCSSWLFIMHCSPHLTESQQNSCHQWRSDRPLGSIDRIARMTQVHENLTKKMPRWIVETAEPRPLRFQRRFLQASMAARINCHNVSTNRYRELLLDCFNTTSVTKDAFGCIFSWYVIHIFPSDRHRYTLSSVLIQG